MIDPSIEYHFSIATLSASLGCRVLVLWLSQVAPKDYTSIIVYIGLVQVNNIIAIVEA